MRQVKLLYRIVCLPVIHLSLIQHTMAITDDGVQNLLPAEHLCLEQLQVHIHILITLLYISTISTHVLLKLL